MPFYLFLFLLFSLTLILLLARLGFFVIFPYHNLHNDVETMPLVECAPVIIRTQKNKIPISSPILTFIILLYRRSQIKRKYTNDLFRLANMG